MIININIFNDGTLKPGQMNGLSTKFNSSNINMVNHGLLDFDFLLNG